MKYWQFVNWEPTPIESALKSRYYGIMELYAPNKSAIYAVLGRYHVLKIVEV